MKLCSNSGSHSGPGGDLRIYCHRYDTITDSNICEEFSLEDVSHSGPGCDLRTTVKRESWDQNFLLENS